MPKLKPDTQRARREHILDAAELSFARSGFHRCTMQDICREAGISPGALYVYFESKESLIAGIVERDRAKLASELSALADAPDLLEALAALGSHYASEQPRHKRILTIDIGCESTRNAAVGEIYRSVDSFCKQSFERLFERAKAEGRIASPLEPKLLAETIAIIGDGMFWRRATDPNFDAKRLMPIIIGLVATLLQPTQSAGSPSLATDPIINEAAQ